MPLGSDEPGKPGGPHHDGPDVRGHGCGWNIKSTYDVILTSLLRQHDVVTLT